MPEADDSARSGAGRRGPGLLFVLFVLVWLLPLGVRPLFEPDEGRYAEIPREMLVSGDLVTPRLNGFPYLEKPPLQYWGTAAFYRVLGVSPFTSRLWCALSGILLGLVVWWGGGRVFGVRAGRFAALLIAGFTMYPGMGLFNTLDMGVTCFLGIALVAFCIAQSSRGEPAVLRRWMLVTWAAMALAVLSKGLIGVILPGGTMLVYSVWSRDREMWRRLHPLRGLTVFLAIAAPWFVLVSLRNPDFPEFFFLREHFARFLSDTHRRGKPFFFFLLVLPAGLLPFTVPVVRALAAGVRRNVVRGGFDVTRLLATWTLFVLVFFSLSNSKLVGYIGPALPAAALLTGAFLARAPASALVGSVRTAAGMAVLILAGAAALPLVHSSRIPPAALSAARPFLLGGGVVLAVGAFLARRWVRRDRGLTAAAALAFAVTAVVSGSFPGLAVVMPGRSSGDVAAAIRARSVPGTRVFLLDCYDQSLPFYLEREVTVVKYQDEFGFGIEHDPGRWIADYPEFVRAWRGAPDAVAVASPKVYDEIVTLGIPMEVVLRTPFRVVLGKPRP